MNPQAGSTSGWRTARDRSAGRRARARVCAAGFTLLELMVVLTLVALALGATLVSVNAHDPAAQALRAAHDLERALNLARVHATSHGRRVDWWPDPAGGRFVLGTAKAGQADRPTPEWGDTPLPGLRPLALPDGYRLRVTRKPATGGAISFGPDGQYTAAEIALEGEEGTVARLRLAAFGPVRLIAGGSAAGPSVAPAPAAGP